MPGTFQAFAVLFILLPGFLAAYILQTLAVRPKQTDLERVIEALIFSFVIYLASIMLIGTTFPVTWRLGRSAAGDVTYSIDAIWWKLLVLFLLPIVFGLGSAFLLEHDSVLGVLRGLRFTQRTGRSSTWVDVMTDVDAVAQVQLADGRSVMGWISYYSDDPDDAFALFGARSLGEHRNQ